MIRNDPKEDPVTTPETIFIAEPGSHEVTTSAVLDASLVNGAASGRTGTEAR
jgi:hypothetical protein